VLKSSILPEEYPEQSVLSFTITINVSAFQNLIADKLEMFQIKLKIGDSEQPDILIKRYEGWYIKPQESFKTNFKA